MSNKIQAYTNLQRWFHNHLIHFVVFLTISGLPIFSKSFSFIAYGAGYPLNWFSSGTSYEQTLAAGVSILRFVHWGSGFLLTLVAIPFVISSLKNIRKLSIWPDVWGIDAIKDGLIQMKKHYIDQEHARFGKMNIGQKASAWVMVVCMVFLCLSGYVLMFRDVVSSDFAMLARSVHSVSFVFLMFTLIFHIYFATHPANRASYEAMFKTGTMDEDVVKEHHSIWYEKLMLAKK